ncbi:MAG: hypothetical protein AAGB46_13560, partial [Verrucomicrobiota bacterium]
IRDEASGTQAELTMRTGNPVSYEKYSIYHYSNSAENRSASFKLVQSPAKQLPYLSLILIIGGLAYHFSRSFMRFLGKEKPAL